MQIYILLYEIETNDTRLKPARVAITNINIVLDDDLNQMRGWNRNTEETPCEKHHRKKTTLAIVTLVKYKLGIILLQRASLV